MKECSNQDFLNAVRADKGTSAEYRERVPEIKKAEDIKQVERILNDYPTVKNEFINTLTNKIVRTDFFSKVYRNPLKELKGGMLPFGTSIEQLFVSYAKTKGFLAKENQDTYDSASALVKRKESDVKAMYIERNFQYVYEVSISDIQLKGAFMSQNGLSELVNQLVSSLTSGAEVQEYKDIIKTLTATANGKYLIQDTSDATKGLLKEAEMQQNKGITQRMAMYELGANPNPRQISTAVRSLAGRMKFMSNKYNMSGVETFSNKEDLVFLTTPEVVAQLDVTVLAQAFNVSSADVNVKIIEVDELPSQFIKKGGNPWTSDDRGKMAKCHGILMDKKFIQAIDTVNTTKNFENGRALYTNIFLHRQGIIANCFFANCVALVETDPTA